MISLFSSTELSLGDKLRNINWLLLLFVCLLAGVGFAMLYAAAGGNVNPWLARQFPRFVVGVLAMLVIAMVDIRIWLKYAYFFYGLAFLTLLSVEFVGEVGQGAQRWISIGGIKLQPSEMMKIGVIMAVARYFQLVKVDEPKLKSLLFPLALITAPAVLVLKQPDLGTAGLILLSGLSVFFAAGVSARYFIVGGILGLIAIPVGWNFLHTYQQKRVLTFLDPERDPLGSGYHIIQSKIALGSGGITGKGYMAGSQSQLNFLPEKQTDFIFTMIGEEFGLLGSASLIGLYVVILMYGYAIALRTHNQFGRLMVVGLMTTFFLYFFINMAMVMGLFPVVGIPLPLVSYGGTAMLAVLISFGLVMNAWVHRDIQLSRTIDF